MARLQRAVLLVVAAAVLAVVLASDSARAAYSVTSVTKQPWGLTLLMGLTGSGGPYGADVQELRADVYYETSTRLHVKLSDANAARWEVPTVVKVPEATTAAASPAYTFGYTETPFSFSVARSGGGGGGEALFETTAADLIFEDQFLQLVSALPQQPYLYGLGERVYQLLLTTGTTYTLFNRDQGTPVQKNLYGSHPLYIEMRDGQAHGVFLLNSNAMDVTLQPGSVQYQTIGGVLDFYFLLGPTPAAVVQQYTELVGRPYMPPYWALGYHQCRWGYRTLNETRAVVDAFAAHQLPLDTMWNDIDYMDSYRDFTFDPVRFPPAQMADFVDWLHAREQQYIVIVDPGIANQTGYAPFDELVASGLYLRDWNDEPILGMVWPGITIFPDFINPATAAQYWLPQVAAFHEVAAFDSLWIDMNEISNFCTGACGGAADPHDPYDHPPFVPGGVALNTSTVSLRALSNDSRQVMYNTHNLYGYSEAIATMTALWQVRQQRSIVISRSSFAGHGAYGSHWLGDNESTWADLVYSIAGVLDFQLFGVPLVGADICGFNGNTTEELCTRWMQLGSFYPFMRNHNSQGQRSQEPYAFGPVLLAASRKALLQRYQLLPYWYSLFYEAHVNGTPVVQPMFFRYGATDAATLPLDRQFMVGDALLVAPVLTQGATSVAAYLPADAGGWYDWYAGALVSSGAAAVNQTLPAPIDTIPVLVRGGAIVPGQQPALTTAAARRNPMQLTVALHAANGSAAGWLYLDDGVSLDTDSTQAYATLAFAAQQLAVTTADGAGGNGSLSAAVTWNQWPSGLAAASLGDVQIFGVPGADAVFANGQLLTAVAYNPAVGVLQLHDLALPLNQPWEITWSWFSSYKS